MSELKKGNYLNQRTIVSQSWISSFVLLPSLCLFTLPLCVLDIGMLSSIQTNSQLHVLQPSMEIC